MGLFLDPDGLPPAASGQELTVLLLALPHTDVGRRAQAYSLYRSEVRVLLSFPSLLPAVVPTCSSLYFDSKRGL